MMNLSDYVLMVVILTVAVTLTVILRLSDLSNQGIWETLRDYWRTFLGEISESPPPSSDDDTPDE